MFDNAVSLNPQSFGGQNVAKVYDLISLGTTQSSAVRRVAATATSTPETLTISHRSVTKGGVVIDQHMVRVDIFATDPVLGLVSMDARIVIDVPRGTTVITDQVIKDQVGRLIAFEQASGALTKILNSEP